MSFSDEAEFDAFIGRDHMLPALTPEAVSSALEGFSLTLLPQRNMDWLAMAVRRSLAISLRSENDGPERISNAKIRAELERLAELARSTWLQLFQCDDPVESRLHTIAWRHWDGEGGDMNEPQEFRRFKSALAEVNWLAAFLLQAAKETASPRGPWREKERKWIRIERGQYLATIFEAAFGRRVSANNYPNDARHKSPTAFMDFYDRMVTLAFGARETANLAEVVKAACHRHRQFPAQFGKGVIPGI